MTRDKVYDAIDTERLHQDRKWGTVEAHPHEVGGWLTIMRNLLTKAESAWSSSGWDYVALNEIRQVLAVGVACCEQHGVRPRSKHLEPTVESMRVQGVCGPLTSPSSHAATAEEDALALAAAIEREACAQIAENCESDNHGEVSAAIAEAIRARGNTKGVK